VSETGSGLTRPGDGGAGRLYDVIGQTYVATRRADPRIGAVIVAGLADAATVVNIGAGSGSYEPPQTVLAIEPSRAMLRQRPAGAAPAVAGVAEHLPLRDDCADAAMAILTIHHWSDVAAGIAEMRRVARRRVVILTWHPDRVGKFWLLDEYLPEAAATDAGMAVPVPRVTGLLDNPQVLPVPIPHDCQDGFGAAYWRRPHAYLDPVVRAGMSMLAKTGEDALRPGLARLAGDLRSGKWRRDHADLLQRDRLDVGYCLIVADA
jgi:SAM-dependent methyltransferase